MFSEPFGSPDVCVCVFIVCVRRVHRLPGSGMSFVLGLEGRATRLSADFHDKFKVVSPWIFLMDVRVVLVPCSH